MAERKYIDLKLYLTRVAGGEGACQVALLPTPEVGESITPEIVPADQAPREEELALLAAKQITMRGLAGLGKRLANCLFPEGTIRERFLAAYERAGVEGGVRLRLILGDHSLKQWPWEYVYFRLLDPGNDTDSMEGFLALNERISMVRHEPLPRPHPQPGAATDNMQEVRMVVAGASPEASDVGLQRLEVNKEIDTIELAIAGYDLEGVQVTAEPVLREATRAQLAEALGQKPTIFHFAGHGAIRYERDDLARDPAKATAYVLLVGEDGESPDWLEARDLARMLRQAGTRLVVLGACVTGLRDARYPWDDVAGALAAGEVPVIIAMQYEVIDSQAIAFSRALYAALGLGLTLDEAVWSGRAAMLEAPGEDGGGAVNVEWGVPVLYNRLSSGALFPERMARATPSAEALRKVFSQTVSGVLSGEMTGVEVRLIKNGVHVIQEVKTVTGEVTGIRAGTAGAGAEIRVDQKAETVKGSMKGAVFDEL